LLAVPTISMQIDIASIRKDYSKQQLDIKDVSANPISQFNKWFDEAIKAEVIEPNAMSLATVGDYGWPSCRIVLLKGIEEGGFVFYTNYDSKKGHQLSIHPFAALTFFWPELERQVRIEGSVRKVAQEVSDQYFQSRPLESRLGAWASPQSKKVNDRAELEQRKDEFAKKFEDQNPSRPDYWGGYVVLPSMMEFWQGRPGRLHDRIQYQLVDDQWMIDRLAP